MAPHCTCSFLGSTTQCIRNFLLPRMVAPHNILIASYKLFEIVFSHQGIIFMEVTDTVTEYQIPYLVMLYHLSWEHMIYMDIIVPDRLTTVKTSPLV